MCEALASIAASSNDLSIANSIIDLLGNFEHSGRFIIELLKNGAVFNSKNCFLDVFLAIASVDPTAANKAYANLAPDKSSQGISNIVFHEDNQVTIYFKNYEALLRPICNGRRGSDIKKHALDILDGDSDFDFDFYYDNSITLQDCFDEMSDENRTILHTILSSRYATHPKEFEEIELEDDFNFYGISITNTSSPLTDFLQEIIHKMQEAQSDAQRESYIKGAIKSLKVDIATAYNNSLVSLSESTVGPIPFKDLASKKDANGFPEYLIYDILPALADGNTLSIDDDHNNPYVDPSPYFNDLLDDVFRAYISTWKTTTKGNGELDY